MIGTILDGDHVTAMAAEDGRRAIARSNDPASARGQLRESKPLDSGFLFWLYLVYVVTFFLHVTQRIRLLGEIRLTLLLAVALIALCVLNHNKLRGRLNSPVSKPIWGLCVWILVSLPFVKWPGSVLRENFEIFFKAALLFFLTALLVDSRRRLGIFVWAFIACQVVRVVEPSYLHWVDGYWGSRTHLGGGEFMARLSGAPSDIINPNGLAFVIASTFPFLHYFLWQARGVIARVAYIALSTIFANALLLTASRSGWIAAAVLLVVLISRSKRKWLGVLVVAVGLAVVSAEMTGGLQDRLRSIYSTDAAQSSSAEGRLKAIATDFSIGLSRPFSGHGLGTSGEARFNERGFGHVSHNMYAEALIELGAIGLILVILLVYRTWVASREVQVQVSTNDMMQGASPARTAAALSAWILMAAIFSFAQYGVSEWHWYLMAGIAVACERVSRTPTELAVAKRAAK